MIILDWSDKKEKERYIDDVKLYLLSLNLNKKDVLSAINNDKITDMLIDIGLLGDIDFKYNKEDGEYIVSIKWLLDCRNGPIDIRLVYGKWKTISSAIESFHTKLYEWWDFIVIHEDQGYRNIKRDKLTNRYKRDYFKYYPQAYKEYDTDILLKCMDIKNSLLNYNWISVNKSLSGQLSIHSTFVHKSLDDTESYVIEWNNFEELFEKYIKFLKSDEGWYYVNVKIKKFYKRNEENQKFETTP